MIQRDIQRYALASAALVAAISFGLAWMVYDRQREQIVASELLTPIDLEQMFRVAGGHWHHGEFALDQLFMMRPTYGAAQYQSPVRGLYLCGAGSHPGGDITGGPGHNAAHEILS